MQNFKKKYACLRSCCWCKVGVKWPICPKQQQRPLGNFIYTTIVCNEYTPLLHYHRIYQISSLEANLSLEDMRLLLDRSHLHIGNIPTPKLIIKPDLF